MLNSLFEGHVVAGIRNFCKGLVLRQIMPGAQSLARIALVALHLVRLCLLLTSIYKTNSLFMVSNRSVLLAF